MPYEQADHTGLLDEIIAFYKKYVVMEDEQYEIVAYWTLHTWVFDAAHVTPYLYVYSQGPASGKTRLLDVIAVTARNARRADDMTSSVMFKIVEREQSTLLLDEIDTIWGGSRNEAKRRILNTGYKRGGCAWREQARELIEFSTFSPKVLAGIKNGFMPATLLDRCIPIEMKRKAKGDPCERFNEFQVLNSRELDELLDRVTAFKEDCFADITAQRPIAIPSLSDRQNEITEPLLAIANVLGHERQLRDTLKHVFQEQGGAQTPIQTILGRIRQAFDGRAKCHTDELCLALGPAYNGRQLALWLEPFGIVPTDIRIGNQVRRGYHADQFERAWAIHLEPEQPDLHVVEDDEEEAA